MSKTNIAKVVVLILIITLLVINITILYTSDLNADVLIKNNLVNDIPTLALGDVALKIVKVDDNDTIKSVLKPKYVALLNRNGIIGGYIYTFERSFPFSSLRINNETSFTYYGDKKFSTISSEIKNNDWFELNKESIFVGPNINNNSYDELEEYYNPKKNTDQISKIGELISDYSKIKKGIKVKDFFKLNFRGDQVTSGPITKHTKTERLTIISDNNFNKINLSCIAFDNGFSDETAESSYISNLYFVKKDRTIIEVPVKSDNSFDIDSIIEKLK